MKSADPQHNPAVDEFEDDGPSIGLTEALTWIGGGKKLIAVATLATAVLAAGIGLLLPKTFTARATLLAPGSQQQSSSAAALAALGSLGGIIGGGAAKTPDELYVALLKSDSVQRVLADRFALKARYDVETYETLRKVLPDRKSVV